MLRVIGSVEERPNRLKSGRLPASDIGGDQRNSVHRAGDQQEVGRFSRTLMSVRPSLTLMQPLC